MPDQLSDQDKAKLQQIARSYLQWNIGSNKQGNLLSKAHFHDHEQDRDKRLYSLKGLVPGVFLQYEEQNWGINLGWTDSATPQTEDAVSRWFFTRQNGTGKPVLYGETIALANGLGRSFLKYIGKPRGINLDWSNSPVFEWQIFGGPGTAGQPVQLNTPVAIKNIKVDEYFVHFNRNFGGDIGWSDSERWEVVFGDWLTGLAKKVGWEKIKDTVDEWIS